MNIKIFQSKSKISWNQIRYILISFNSFLFWGWAASSRADAAGIPFTTLFNAAADQTKTFVGLTGAPQQIGDMIGGFMTFIPWIVLILVGSIVAWQTYEAYKEYQRENLSGAVKPALNIIVLLVFVFIADRATSYLATGN
jgi:ABC-type transporter Mla maintaining outer membrane lipid asymmetry permease subunit MlaE